MGWWRREGGGASINHKGFQTCNKRSRLARDMILNLIKLNSNRKLKIRVGWCSVQWDVVKHWVNYSCGSHIHIIHKHATKKVRHAT